MTTVPLAIRLRSESRQLELELADGHVTTVTHAELRGSCRCALCVTTRRRDGSIDVSPEIRLISVAPCGASAVQLTFSDGHSRGIYPFAWLQSLAATG